MGCCTTTTSLAFLWMAAGFLACVVEANRAPLFFNLPARLKLREDEPVGSRVFTMFGFDWDWRGTPNGRIHYILTPVDHTDFKFSVDASTGHMYLVQSLDYETKQSYRLAAEVADVGDPPLSSRKTLLVDVIDVNDNSPSCRITNVLGSLTEEADVGDLIGELNCTDPDTGDGGVIDFQVIGGDTDVIDISTTGQATLKRRVDYDTEPDTYEVDVKVKDRGSPQLFSMAKVILSLQDVDDIIPTFSQPGGYSANIKENTPLGTTVLMLTATDGDSPNTEASRVRYGLETTPVPDWLNVDPFSGSLVVKRNIDWEEEQVIECDVYAHSSDQFASRSVVHVTVHIDDVNDGIPDFDQVYYKVSVNESTALGTEVAVINATDRDDGPDGHVTYAIQGESIFEINKNSGVLTLKEPADYENWKSYLLKVIATDGGIPSTSNSVFVQVTVLPENEFAPVFVPPFTFDVSEDLAPGSSVFSVTTLDGDEGLDGLIGYRVVNQVPFLIDTGTGVIRVAYDLDFESVTSYNLIIEAVDNSTTRPKSAQQTFVVNILDANDVPAVCEYVPTLVVRHPFPIGDRIWQMVCSDLDTDASGLSYNISHGNDGTFTMKAGGQLVLVSEPIKSQYDLTVEVDDGGGVEQITSLLFTVFAETTLQFRNVPDTIVVNESSSLTTQPVDAQLGYAFPPVHSALAGGNDEHQLVYVQGPDELFFAMDFDYENPGNYTYTLEASSISGQSVKKTFNIQVQDVNDNVPKFDSTVFEFKLSESLLVNSDIYMLSAVDYDEGVNSNLNYSIPAGNEDGIFAIDSLGMLKIVSPLHYESKITHTLEIEAADSGTPSLTGTTTVIIKVFNVIEDDPQLISVSGDTRFRLSEDSPLGSTVFRLTVSEQEHVPDIIFNIESGNEENHFGVESSSGAVYLTKLLDRESKSFFSIVMSANNKNGNKVMGSIDIDVDDVNDNVPIFSETVYRMDVPHGQTPGFKVGELRVSDKDIEDNGNITLSIENGNVGSAFKLSGNEILTAIETNYNALKSYSLFVVATDHGVPALSSSAVVYIRVTPIVSLPQFPAPSMKVKVHESTFVGGHVVDLDATSLGASENDGSLKYEIVSGDLDSHFHLDSQSGVLTTVRELDYETGDQYTLVVSAINVLDPAQRDEITLTISVENVNEFSPSFAPPSYHWEVSETTMVSSLMGNVVVEDRDGGLFGNFTISISGSEDFEIDSFSGAVTVATNLDFRRQNLYSLIVTATDHGIPVKSSIASVTVKIIDENNHSPSFTQMNYSTQIYSLIPVGSEVFHFHAVDLDTGRFGNVSYSMISNPNTGHFELDSVTGILTTTGSLDIVTYSLMVEARDGCSPSRKSSATVDITVLPGYGDNNAPSFASAPLLTLTVSRNAGPGFEISAVGATDPDSGENGDLVYYIFSGNEDGFFLLDEEYGNLTTATWLYTANNSYSLVINVVDGGKPPQSSSITVNVDVNPTRTTSKIKDFSFSVSEDVSIGYQVGRILVDAGRLASGYDIINGNHGDAFIIHTDVSGEGLMRVQSILDFEEFSLYSLLVIVSTDLGNETKIVEISVIDVNDEPPHFQSSALTLSIPENMSPGYTLTTISYEDNDITPAYKNATFEITNHADSYLQIDHFGNLILDKSPDFETAPHFEATVTLIQASFPTASLAVTVDVVDIEETQTVNSAPSSRASFVSLELPHKVTTGYLVHTLTLDNCGLNSSLSVEYISFNVVPPFTVDATSGDITVSNHGSLEAQTSYLRWIVCRTASESALVLVRLDTYNRDRYMVVVEFGEPEDIVREKQHVFLARAQAFFSGNARVGMSLIFDDIITGLNRRRLLATRTLAALYVLSDDSADGLSHVTSQKLFLSQAEVLKTLQKSPDGTPVTGLSDPNSLTVTRVVGFVATEDEAEPFASSTMGVVIFALLGLLALMAALTLMYCWARKRKFCILCQTQEKMDVKDLLHNRQRASIQENDDIPINGRINANHAPFPNKENTNRVPADNGFEAGGSSCWFESKKNQSDSEEYSTTGSDELKVKRENSFSRLEMENGNLPLPPSMTLQLGEVSQINAPIAVHVESSPSLGAHSTYSYNSTTDYDDDDDDEDEEVERMAAPGFRPDY